MPGRCLLGKLPNEGCNIQPGSKGKHMLPYRAAGRAVPGEAGGVPSALTQAWGLGGGLGTPVLWTHPSSGPVCPGKPPLLGLATH